MRSRVLQLMIGAIAIMAVAGCGASSGVTAEEEAAFKQHDASKMKPPPADAMQKPDDFKSSIQSGPGGSMQSQDSKG